MIRFTWLKSMMPRSMFGRSLLILLFPVVFLQLVVGMVFIQRHFESVTTQMARPVATELNYIADLADSAASAEGAPAMLATFARPFNMLFEISPDETLIPEFRSKFYDVSGRALIESLSADIERPISIDLTADWRNVLVGIQTNKGILNVVFSRSRVSASNPHQLLVMMLVASIFLTVISVLFLKNQVRPIRELARVSEAFGKGRSETLRPSGAIEIRRAGHAFLAMRARLERQIEQRTQMLSGVSHDLRTPLTRMKLSLALMEENDEIRLLCQDVEDMEKMLGIFLDFARQDSLEETLSTNPEVLINKIVTDSQRSNHNVSYEFKALTNGSNSVMMRPLAISRAISNLVSNANRFAQTVHIIGSLTETFLTISVEDDGPGIPETDRDDALKPFVRLDKSRNQNESGVGLGMSIAADVARSHGGTLELSESKFGGLKAVLSIPR